MDAWPLVGRDGELAAIEEAFAGDLAQARAVADHGYARGRGRRADDGERLGICSRTEVRTLLGY